jgi:hypothetical protein
MDNLQSMCLDAAVLCQLLCGLFFSCACVGGGIKVQVTAKAAGGCAGEGRGAGLAGVHHEAGASEQAPGGAAAVRRVRRGGEPVHARLQRAAPPPEDHRGGPRRGGPSSHAA